MLKLESISLVQFKNYINRQFRFPSRVVGISGRNGAGKTNLLDAIYYLCFTKSYFGRSDLQNVRSGMAGFRIGGELTKSGDLFNAVCILRETGKKEFSVNGEPAERFSRHIGRFPCVVVAPDDVRMITEGSEERRRYLDAIISQLDSDYLQRLISYNKILSQRNSYLKAIAGGQPADAGLLDIYDAQLSADGQKLFTARKAFTEECIGRIRHLYQRISGSDEQLDVEYQSQLHHNDMAQLLASTRERDLFLQRTAAGIHKDDLVLTIAGQPFRQTASQGQRKSLLFALKLAEFEMIREKKGFAPLLLLDDVFEKLDEHRMHQLLEWVCNANDGQIFITDTHAARIREHFDKIALDYQLIEI